VNRNEMRVAVSLVRVAKCLESALSKGFSVHWYMYAWKYF
jgi:hypothetical protein